MRPERRVTTQSGRELSVETLRAAWEEWGTLIAFLDDVERSVTYTHEEYLSLPAQLRAIRAACGFSRANQEDERLANMLKAIFGDSSHGKNANRH